MGGYLMEHGQIGVLVQPAELIIIGGAALGTLLIANPLSTVIRIFKGLLSVLKGSPYTKDHLSANAQDAERAVHAGSQAGHGQAGGGHRGSGKEPGF